MGMRRMTFLIDEAGTIQRIWSMVKPDGHAAEVLAAIHQEKARL
jgi:peroxiredoxin Q/BCP